MQINGRILIVSGRDDVVAELQPIIRRGGHLARTVRSSEEAVEALTTGPVPDIIISDAAGGGAAPPHLERFRALNRLGKHFVVVDDDDARADDGDPDAVLVRPLADERVGECIEEAIRRLDRELLSLRAKMWQEISDLQQQMRGMQREVVNALAATIAARDPYMHGHAQRVAELGVRVAARLGMGAAALDTLEMAALLHEIGKASVPIELLHKTTPLTPDELERIRGHARVGAGIVGAVPALHRTVPIIEHQGTDFTELGAQVDAESEEFLLTCILHTVDAFDAMTSDRSYRPALPASHGAAKLQEGAGTRHHPAVVRALLEEVGVAPARAA